jgi:glycosyltransferase involved in cell wall biosynthesis
MSKLNIYAILTTIQTLVPSSGDKINEINLYKAISTFANVYYNNQLFRPQAPNFGIKPEVILVNPKIKYNICYIRNNLKVFNAYNNFKVKNVGYKPKILWVATPYKERVFKEADGVVAYTDSWGRQLRTLGKHNIEGLYKPGTYIPKNILVFPQAIDLNEFKPKHNTHKAKLYRKRFEGDFVIAHFGRIAAGNYPHSLLHILPRVIEKYPDVNIKFVYCGLPSQIKMNLSHPSVKVLPGIPYEDMSYAISACDLITSDYRAGTANWGGSRHVLESMGCGVPVLTGDFTVRKEQLGSDYELFWKWTPNKGRVSEEAEEQMFKHICSLIDSPDRGKKIGANLMKRVEKYSFKNVGKRIQAELNKVL